jgi:hypothetical protein
VLLILGILLGDLYQINVFKCVLQDFSSDY